MRTFNRLIYFGITGFLVPFVVVLLFPERSQSLTIANSLALPYATIGPTWIQKSFEQYSILWLLTSSILGGIIGASTKLLFEVVFPYHLQQRNEVIAIKRKYTTPILLAAELLRNRFKNIIKNIEKLQDGRWLSVETPGYYYLSTIYVVANFLGWIGILRQTVTFLDLTSTKETRRFERYLDTIEAGFSNPGLLSKAKSGTLPNLELKDTWVPAFEIQAIGEVMIRVTEKSECTTLDFATFKKYFSQKDDSEFRDWLKCLDTLLLDLASSDVRFHRIIAIHCILNDFVDYLDPHHIRTEKQESYWHLLSEQERDTLRERIAKI